MARRRIAALAALAAADCAWVAPHLGARLPALAPRWRRQRALAMPSSFIERDGWQKRVLREGFGQPPPSGSWCEVQFTAWVLEGNEVGKRSERYLVGVWNV